MLHMGGLSVRDIAETDEVTQQAVYSQIAKVADALRKNPTLSEYNRKAIPRRSANRHRGNGRPLSPATPPDVRVRIGRFRGLRKTIEESRKLEGVEVGERKRDGQGRAVRHTPGTVRTTRRLCSECLINPVLT
jgi:hypothetical protein